MLSFALALPTALAQPATQDPAPTIHPDLPTVAFAEEPPAGALADEGLRVLDALVEVFRQNYWDAEHRDWAAWGADYRDQVLAASDRASLDRTLRRMVQGLEDDHSAWLGQPSSGQGGGAGSVERDQGPRLGIQLGFVQGRGLVVERVFSGAPADLAGLRRADVIVAVDGADLRQRGSLFMAFGDLTEALAGGSVRLEVERGRLRLEIEVEAGTFDMVAAQMPYAVMLDASVGYLHVPSFNLVGVGSATHRAVRGLAEQGARALVLDLRGNLGGRLVEAGLTIGLFLDGSWAQAMARGEPAWYADYQLERSAGGRLLGVSRLRTQGGRSLAETRISDPYRFQGPVVVITGSESTSAAEIVAMVLVRSGLARSVGEATAGNVEAVRSFELFDGSGVLVAVANLQGMDGEAFESGVRPEIEASASVRDLARGQDPPVSEARRLLGGLPFTPGRYF